MNKIDIQYVRIFFFFVFFSNFVSFVSFQRKR